tara:strand:- start:199 stop:2055 length:1857 start_codon:yes stop_codon:yes gene_type:complete
MEEQETKQDPNNHNNIEYQENNPDLNKTTNHQETTATEHLPTPETSPSETPTAEQLLPNSNHPEPINKKKPLTIKNIFLGWIEDNYDKLFLIILIAAFIIRILVYTKTQDQALWWDAADYMVSAKKWGLNLNGLDLWYYRRGFLWPMIGAFFFKIGLGELSIRFLVAILSTGIVLASYLLIKEMFNNRLALLTSIPVAFSWVFIFFTGRPLTNLPATFFFIFALLFFWKSYVKNQGHIYSILFGIFFALSALIRMQYLMFSVAFLALAIVKEKHKFLVSKKLWISIIAFFIILIPQFYWQSTKFGNPILDLATYYLGVGGSQSGEVGVQLAKFSDLFVYFNNIPYILDANQAGYSTLFILTPLYTLFLIGFVLFFSDLFLNLNKLFKSQKLQKKFFILFWTFSAFLFLGYIAPHLEQRYIMPIIPFLFLITVYPLYLSAIYIKDKYKDKFNNKFNPIIIFIIISSILIILMIPNYNFGNSLIDSKTASYKEIKQAGEWIKANSNPEDIIIGGSLPQLTYYSERTVYPFHLAYRRDIEQKQEADLDKFILENRPLYFSISGYEAEKDWAFAYPQKHSDLLTPVQAFGPDPNQPILVIYRFDYSNIEAVARLADLSGVGL